MIDFLQVFILSMTPLGELRLSIPMGVLVYDLNAISVLIVSIIGNFIPALFILIFLKKFSKWFSEKSKIFHKVFTWWENNARNKHMEKIKDYGAIGVAVFVGIPLPMTGAWTGSLLATLMDLPLKKSIPAVFTGIVGAGILMSIMVSAGVNIEKYFGWQILIGVIILITAVILVYKFFRKKYKKQ